MLCVHTILQQYENVLHGNIVKELYDWVEERRCLYLVGTLRSCIMELKCNGC